jgi:pantoate--beta-alanine ligase
MKVVASLDALRDARASLPDPLGLVPTMGFLHEGHLSLVRRARAECASAAASIFVNPTQFAPSEDLSSYPRDLDRDLELLESEGVDLVWTPTEEEMYPPGFQTWVMVEKLTHPLEGAHRPGHFKGVTTVVAKLFNAFQPQRAYFGQKDAQQAVVIRRMAMDLDFPLQIIVCPTVRESDGLAMSSRNSYFDPQQRRAAVVLFQALSRASEAFEAGERRSEKLRQWMIETLGEEKLARPEYVSVADPETLEELSGTIERGLLSMAVFIGKVRLIDNMLVGKKLEA